jgi:perosamine synthetase
LLPQLPSLREQNLVRQQNVATLMQELSTETRLQPVANPGDRGTSGYYKVAWLYQPTPLWPRARFLAAVQAEGVALYEGFRGFAGRSAGRCRRVGELPHSQGAAAQTVILHHPVLLQNESTIRRVAAALQKVLRQEATVAADLS